MKADSQARAVYEEIRRMILIAQVVPGTRLKEDFWAEKLAVGRMAVREALNRLYGEGLVVAGAKGGYYVAELTVADVRQIREVREVLELAAVRLAMHRITEAELDELLRICDDFTDLVGKGYFAGACEADIRFHQALVAGSGNDRLLRAYHFSHIPLFHQQLGKTRAYMDDYALTDREHRQLVEAIRSRDMPLAEKTLLAHFKRGETAVISLA